MEHFADTRCCVFTPAVYSICAVLYGIALQTVRSCLQKVAKWAKYWRKQASRIQEQNSLNFAKMKSTGAEKTACSAMPRL